MLFQSAGEFAWDEKTQGIILGAFFLGYVTTNVPGGRMAEKMGGKLIYGLGVFLTAVLTVISPFAAYWGLVPFLVVRVAEGFTEVVLLFKTHCLKHIALLLESCRRAASLSLIRTFAGTMRKRLNDDRSSTALIAKEHRASSHVKTVRHDLDNA